LQIHDAVHAKRDEMSAYDAEKQIKAQIMAALDNPESVKKILAVMQEDFEKRDPDHIAYAYYKEGLEAVRKYSEGKYNLFPGSHFRKTVIRTVTAEETSTEQAAPMVADEQITDEYDLHLGAEVHIGTTECIINSMSEETVELFDGTLFPLELDTQTFLKRLRENPLNDHLLKEPKPPRAEQTVISPQKIGTPPKNKAPKEKTPTKEALIQSIKDSFDRWDMYMDGGGSDPTCADGFNMNLLRQRIIQEREQLLTFTE
jgi:hypothetical protein